MGVLSGLSNNLSMLLLLISAGSLRFVVAFLLQVFCTYIPLHGMSVLHGVGWLILNGHK